MEAKKQIQFKDRVVVVTRCLTGCMFADAKYYRCNAAEDYFPLDFCCNADKIPEDCPLEDYVEEG